MTINTEKMTEVQNMGEEKTKLCPMLFIGVNAANAGLRDILAPGNMAFFACAGARCAWWAGGMCAASAMTHTLIEGPKENDSGGYCYTCEYYKQGYYDREKWKCGHTQSRRYDTYVYGDDRCGLWVKRT